MRSPLNLLLCAAICFLGCGEPEKAPVAKQPATKETPPTGKPHPSNADDPQQPKAESPQSPSADNTSKATDKRQAALPDAQTPQKANGQGGLSGVAAIFAKRDQNSDGKLTGEEITSRMQRDIDAIDQDKDGEITSDEFQAFYQQFTKRPPPSPGDTN